VQTRREFDKQHRRNTWRSRRANALSHLGSQPPHPRISARPGFRRPARSPPQQRQRADENDFAASPSAFARASTNRANAHRRYLRIASFDFRVNIAAFRLRLEKRTAELASASTRVLRVKRERWQRLALQLQERGSSESLGTRLRHRHRRRRQPPPLRGSSPARRPRIHPTPPCRLPPKCARGCNMKLTLSHRALSLPRLRSFLLDLL